MKYPLSLVVIGVGLMAAAAAHAQNERDTKVHDDRRSFEAADGWVYNDLETGIAQARAEDKPLLIVLRCIP